jgi:hypothetical protein
VGIPTDAKPITDLKENHSLTRSCSSVSREAGNARPSASSAHRTLEFRWVVARCHNANDSVSPSMVSFGGWEQRPEAGTSTEGRC